MKKSRKLTVSYIVILKLRVLYTTIYKIAIVEPRMIFVSDVNKPIPFSQESIFKTM